MPTWIRSSISTLAGSLAIIWCARRRTSAAVLLRASSSGPAGLWRCTWCAPRDSLNAAADGGVGVACRARRRSADRRRRASTRARSRTRRRSSASALASASPAGSIADPVAQHARRRSRRRRSPSASRCARRAASCGAAPSSRSCTTRPARCVEQLHRRVGVGHARGPVVGEQRSGATRSIVGSAARDGARTAGRARCAGVDEHARRSRGAASATRCRNARGRAGRHRRSGSAGRAPRRYETCGRQRLDALGQVEQRHLAGRLARSAASTTRRAAPRSAKAVHRRSSITPPKATCGFETTGTKRARACGEHAAQAVGLVDAARDAIGMGVGAVRRSEASSAQARSVRGCARCPAARRRSGSRRWRRACQAALPPPRSARCTSALADRRCQSSGTRWPLATPTILSLWRISGVERRAELDGLVDLADSTMPAQLARVVGDQHVLDRLALRRGVDDEQLLDRAVR